MVDELSLSDAYTFDIRAAPFYLSLDYAIFSFWFPVRGAQNHSIGEHAFSRSGGLCSSYVWLNSKQLSYKKGRKVGSSSSSAVTYFFFFLSLRPCDSLSLE